MSRDDVFRLQDIQRDVISHSYFRVDMEIIWQTVDQDVPKLAVAVDRLLDN